MNYSNIHTYQCIYPLLQQHMFVILIVYDPSLLGSEQRPTHPSPLKAAEPFA